MPIHPTLEHESKLWQEGFLRVGGTDEVGRGALAGPVVAAVVVLPFDKGILKLLDGVRDSKTLSAKQRARLVDPITRHSLCYGIGAVSAHEVDHIGIVRAVKQAMLLALAACKEQPDALIIDALSLNIEIRQVSFPKADVHSLAVAAASIIAKEHRDALMRDFAQTYPQYGFEAHVGYGSAVHRAALLEHGTTPIHRKTFIHNFLLPKSNAATWSPTDDVGSVPHPSVDINLDSLPL